MRSGPTSRGLSIRIGRPLRTPGPISSVSTSSARSPTPVHSTASTGTVEDTTSALTSVVSRSRSASSPSSCTARSSLVRSGRVAMRQVWASSAPRQSPRCVCVLPTSTASSIGRYSVGGSSGGLLSGGRSSSIVTSCVVWMSVRGMMRVGRFLSHTQTSSIATWIIG
jgi:hypothetical protein